MIQEDYLRYNSLVNFSAASCRQLPVHDADWTLKSPTMGKDNGLFADITCISSRPRLKAKMKNKLLYIRN